MRHILYLLFMILPWPLAAQMIYTVGGNGSEYYAGDGGPATSAQIGNPEDVVISRKGNIYIADNLNHVIRKINPVGIITTFAGNHIMGYGGDSGPATAGSINFPKAVAVDTAENVYLADRNNVVRKINKLGIISTVAGGGISLGDGGPATNANLYNPAGLAVDKAGNIYISDGGNGRIRKVNTSGIISTIAGTGVSGYSGDGGPATAAKIQAPVNIKFDTSGNLYFAAYGNMVIRKISNTGIITTVAGNGYSPSPGIGGYSGDGGPATDAELNGPDGIALDKFGNLYISDYQNDVIRMVNANGIINTIAGNGFGGYGGSGVLAATSELNGPLGMDVDSNGVLYFADIANNRIQKIIMNCLPSIISGPDSMCAGSSATLTDSLSGGLWSSTNSNASVNSAGVLTGISPGLDTILYTMNNGCGVNSSYLYVSVEVPVTVAPITGTDSVCIGSSVTLADAIPGGLWSLSNANATVGLTGKVTGIAAGYDSLIYTVTNSCGVYHNNRLIKVNSLPTIGVINGPDSVCMDAEITLTDTTSGGIWNVSNTHAYIFGGTFTGLTKGIDTVSYTITAVCTAKSIKAIKVLPQPYADQIYGNIKICPGDSTWLIDTVSNGIWLTSNNNATVHNGHVKGISSGVDSIIYSVTNSCNTAIAYVVVTIDPMPDAGTITGPDEVCVGAQITLDSSVAGGTWAAYNTNVNMSYNVATGITTGTDTITYVILNNCGAAYANHIITIDSLPYAGIVSGPQTLCDGDSIALSDSIGGGIWSSAYKLCTISSLSNIIGATEGMDTILYNVTNSCGTTSAAYPLLIYPSPAGIISRQGDYLSVPSGFNTYQWLDNGQPINNAVTEKYNFTDTGTYSVIVINSSGCAAELGPLLISECNAADIQIYPNPANEIIFINWCKKVNVRITTLEGNLVKEIRNASQVNISDLPSGIYSVTLFDEFHKRLLTKQITKLPK